MRPELLARADANERGWGGPVEDGAWLIASRYLRNARDSTGPVVTVGDDGP